MDGKRRDSSRTEAELQAIGTVLTELSGLVSRWSGRVELVPEADFKGKKRFTCDIQINADLAQQEARWATLIHEALHTLSAGYIGMDYREFPGWEEGAVERLQRLYRPAVLTRLGVLVPDEVFLEAEAKHNYNKYIAALERVRPHLGLPDERFYLLLLRTPIKDRPSLMFGLGNQLPGQRRVAFAYAFSAANAVLKDFIQEERKP